MATSTCTMLAAAILSLLSVAAQTTSPLGCKVIANASVTALSVSADELRGILLATRTSLADGGHVEPVFFKSGSVHDVFVRQLTGKSATGLENYFRSLVFTGRGAMPKMLTSDEEMVAYVRATKGAIGYVSSGSSTEGVKVLEVR